MASNKPSKYTTVDDIIKNQTMANAIFRDFHDKQDTPVQRLLVAYFARDSVVKKPEDVYHAVGLIQIDDQWYLSQYGMREGVMLNLNSPIPKYDVFGDDQGRLTSPEPKTVVNGVWTNFPNANYPLYELRGYSEYGFIKMVEVRVPSSYTVHDFFLVSSKYTKKYVTTSTSSIGIHTGCVCFDFIHMVMESMGVDYKNGFLVKNNRTKPPRLVPAWYTYGNSNLACKTFGNFISFK